MWEGDSPTFLGPSTVSGVHSHLLPVRAWHLGGTRALLEQTPPWCWTASQQEQHREAGVHRSLRRFEGRAPPTCCPPLPSHLTNVLHAPLTPSQNPVWVPLGTAHPPWGQNRVFGAGQQRPLPSLTPHEGRSQNPRWHFRRLSGQVPPKVPL